MSARALCWLLIGLAGCHVGGSCGGGSGGGGAPPEVAVVEAADERCTRVGAGFFPPGFDFVPGVSGRVVVSSFVPVAVLTLDVGFVPPRVVFQNPPDLGTTIKNAVCPGFLDPAPDGIRALDAGHALLTTSGCEALTLVDPANGNARDFDVTIPAGLPNTFPLAPAPGTTVSAPSVSTFACVQLPAGSVDSAGRAIGPDPTCGGVSSHLTTFTAGVARAAGRLFVPMSNLLTGQGTPAPGFAPGALLVFDLDLSVVPPAISPHATLPVLATDAFNPIEATPYTTPGGRELVLVTVAGSLGIVADDPGTTEIESGGLALTPGAIEVLDANTLDWLAHIPLGLVGLAGDGLTIDPSGRVGIVGSAAGRELYAVDLEPLDALPVAPVPPILLDGSDVRAANADARIFHAGAPFALPKRVGGAGPECGAFVTGLAWNDAGDKAFAAEDCDGTLTILDVNLGAAPPVPVPANRFNVLDLKNIAAPIGPTALGDPKRPGMLNVRPGVPGVTYTGPDVLFILGDPEGELCGIRIDSV